MQQAVIEAQMQLARNVTAQGGKVLVVGVKAGNVSQDLWNHPRLVFYESKSHGDADTREVPANVKLIVFTRFVTHPTHKHFTKIANKRGLHCLHALHSSGELRKVLEEVQVVTPEGFKVNANTTADAIDYTKTEPHTPYVAPPEGKMRGIHGGYYTPVEMTSKDGKATKGSSLRFAHEWCENHYGDIVNVPKKFANSARIIEEAHHVGLKSTSGAIMQSFVKVRERAKMARELQHKEAQSTPAPAEPTTPPPSAIAPLDPSHPLTMQSITMIEDTIANLELLKEKLLTDYANIDQIVKARVKVRLQAFVEA